ncbi:MAG: Mur ligase family protein, partial [candidate division WOR-3 bacterium]
MTFAQALGFLKRLPNYEQLTRTRMTFSLEPFRRFLATIDSPEKRLRNVLLVAGTKGKGSTCHLIDSVLRSAGYRTGLFTSPHLLDLRERIQVSGRMIGRSDFARIVGGLRQAILAHPITWFEALTAIAFVYFLEQEVDYTILEVGLGGRFDATNVAQPLISVITRIGLDHTEVLGRSLAMIAREKSGIFRPRTPAVLARQPLPALKSLEQAARTIETPLIQAATEVRVSKLWLDANGTLFQLQPGKIPCPRGSTWDLALVGRHQVENAQTVLALILELR